MPAVLLSSFFCLVFLQMSIMLGFSVQAANTATVIDDVVGHDDGSRIENSEPRSSTSAHPHSSTLTAAAIDRQQRNRCRIRMVLTCSPGPLLMAILQTPHGTHQLIQALESDLGVALNLPVVIVHSALATPARLNDDDDPTRRPETSSPSPSVSVVLGPMAYTVDFELGCTSNCDAIDVASLSGKALWLVSTIKLILASIPLNHDDANGTTFIVARFINEMEHAPTQTLSSVPSSRRVDNPSNQSSPTSQASSSPPTTWIAVGVGLGVTSILALIIGLGCLYARRHRRVIDPQTPQSPSAPLTTVVTLGSERPPRQPPALCWDATSVEGALEEDHHRRFPLGAPAHTVVTIPLEAERYREEEVEDSLAQTPEPSRGITTPSRVHCWDDFGTLLATLPPPIPSSSAYRQEDGGGGSQDSPHYIGDDDLPRPSDQPHLPATATGAATTRKSTERRPSPPTDNRGGLPYAVGELAPSE